MIVRSQADFLARQGNLEHATVVGLDLRGLIWDGVRLDGSVFLGCEFDSPGQEMDLYSRGARLFPAFERLPYDPYRSSLYTWQELMKGYTPEHDASVDRQIYDHFQSKGRVRPGVREALARRLHDHAMEECLQALLVNYPRVVGLMGGHGVLRTDPNYRQAVRLTWRLTRLGYFVTTGGGPGLMEAGNLGAYLAGQPEEAVDAALELLNPAPSFHDEGYLGTSLAVLAAFPTGSQSLAVPTWFYGHEPSNLFATHIAKFFSNSLREEWLLCSAVDGVVYAPGSAGTTQEIFQDATQNHYGSYNFYSPMVFLGVKHYVEDTGIYPLLERLARGHVYHDLLYLSDDPEQIVEFLRTHPPIQVTPAVGLLHEHRSPQPRAEGAPPAQGI